MSFLSDSMPRIHRLETSAQHEIEASQIFPSFRCVLKALLENSIDAMATFITATIDTEHLKVSVSDDGHGIDKNGLKLIFSGHASSRNNLAQFSTCEISSSKVGPLVNNDLNSLTPEKQSLKTKTYHNRFLGSFGRSLYALSMISSVTITTKSSGTTFRKIVKFGKLISFEQVENNRQNIGTTVEITNLFERHPVRRKFLQKTRNRTIRARCRRLVNVISLLLPKVSFLLYDHCHRNTYQRLPACASTLERFMMCFGEKYIPHMVPIESSWSKDPEVSSAFICVSGYFSTQPTTSDELQFIFVNRYFLNVSDKLYSYIRSFIDKHHLFVGTSKVSLLHSVSDGQNSPHWPLKRKKSKKSSNLSSSFAKLESDSARFPAYILHIECPLCEYNFHLSGSRRTVDFVNSKMIIDTVGSAIASAFAGVFASIRTKIDHASNESENDVIAKFKPGTVENVNAVTRIRKRSRQQTRRFSTLSQAPHKPGQQHTRPILDILLRTKAEAKKNPNSQSGPDHMESSLMLYWQKFAYNNSEETQSNNASIDSEIREHLSDAPQSFIPQESQALQTPNTLTNHAECSTSIQNLFHKWTNPVAATSTLVHLLRPNATTNVSKRLSKNMLKKAVVIGQADRKFIFAKADSCLICFDQHAVDERIRLERLEKDLSGQIDSIAVRANSSQGSTCRISVPVNIAETCDRYRQEAQQWGFEFEISNGYLNLIRQPLCLGQLLTAEDLVEYITGLQRGTINEQRGMPSSNDVGAKAITLSGRLPPAVRRILNSKACRGAIMFGDSLSQSQCQSMIQKLAHCRNPFQCAHGRPSAVPVLLFPKKEN